MLEGLKLTKIRVYDSGFSHDCEVALQGLWSVFQNVHHTFVTIN